MEKMKQNGLNLKEENIEKLKKLFPECISDGKIDFDKLKVFLSDFIESNNEKYSFNWVGKNNSIKVSQEASGCTLIPLKEKSVDWDNTNNIYIEGDNLDVLKVLNKTYHSKVKFIYIDPPYNTGNDFVYRDDFASQTDSYLEASMQNFKVNPDTSGRFHTNWLNMMYPRLIQASNLLADNGVICVSIDDREVERLKLICNEIFGENNFVACIVWERAYSPVNLKKHFSESHDFILIYAKNIDELVCNGLKRTAEANDRYINPDNDPRGPWKSSDFSVGPRVEKNVYEITTPSGRVVLPPSGRCWRVTKEKYEELLADNRVWFGEDGSNVPSTKRFLSEVKQGMTPMTIWKYTEVGHSQDAAQSLKKIFDGKMYFDYPKPVKLIKQLISLYDSDDCVVLDFFSGSGTTAQAVMELNAEDGKKRKYILVQLPEKCDEKSEAFIDGYKTICDVGEERIKRCAQNIRNELKQKKKEAGLFENDVIDASNVDFGFKVFALDTTNIVQWDPSYKYDENSIFDLINIFKNGRTSLDVAYEIMLKYGVFNMPLEEVIINGKNVYSVGSNYMIISLNNEITTSDIEAIAKLQPKAVVFKESGFVDDNAKINADYTFKRLGIDNVKCI